MFGVTVLALANVFRDVEEVSGVELNTRLVSQDRQDDARAGMRHPALHNIVYTNRYMLLYIKPHLAASPGSGWSSQAEIVVESTAFDVVDDVSELSG